MNAVKRKFGLKRAAPKTMRESAGKFNADKIKQEDLASAASGGQDAAD